MMALKKSISKMRAPDFAFSPHEKGERRLPFRRTRSLGCESARQVGAVLSARIDPVARPARRIFQRLFFALEVVERIEPVGGFGLRVVGAFEKQIG